MSLLTPDTTAATDTAVATPDIAAAGGSPRVAQGATKQVQKSWWKRRLLRWRRRWNRLITKLKAEKTRQLLHRKAVAAWMNVLIIAAAVVTAGTAGFLAEQHWPVAATWGPGALKLFTLWCLAFMPGWLYIRFLGLRAKALWTEYVLTLYRLGWDLPHNLPEPPVSSDFHAKWLAHNGPAMAGRENIYRQKFEAYYGRQVTPDHPAPGQPASSASSRSRQRSGGGENFVVRIESLFPIFLATAVFAVGWAAVLWDTHFLTAPDGIWDVLKYGFIGAYAFVLSMLIRRFFQTDLRPSAYASAVLRVMLVLLLVAVLHQILPSSPEAVVRGELAFAFLIGFFPLVGLSFIQQVVSKTFGGVVPSLKSEYPLDQLDGFSLWYEARLMEEGIEDMQNLTTVNFVDVVLHTRVPPGRLVDWIDQAFLLIHLEPTTREALTLERQGKAADEYIEGARARVALRRVGIRTATDLLKAFSIHGSAPCDGSGQPLPNVTVPGMAADHLRLLVGVLAADPGLAPVWNWQRNGVLVGPADKAIDPHA
jgi:hypothetical protein